MGNGLGLPITSVGSTCVYSPHDSTIILAFNDILYVPKITKNLPSVSKLSHDNHVFFEFHSHVCYVISQVNKTGSLNWTGELSRSMFPRLIVAAKSTSPQCLGVSGCNPLHFSPLTNCVNKESFCNCIKL